MTSSRWPYVLLGLIAYLVFLAIELPAERAWPWLQERLGLPDIEHLQGRLTGGRGQGLTLGAIDIDELQWRWRPGSLALGRIGLETHALSRQIGRFDGRLELGLDGRLRASEVSVSSSAERLGALVGQLDGVLAGRIELELPQLRLDGRRLESLDGTLRWRDAALTRPQAVKLGDLQLDLGLADDGIRGVIRDAGGPLEATGELRIGHDGSYRIEATLGARNDHDKALRSALGWLGRADERGRVKVDFRGRIPGWPFAS